MTHSQGRRNYVQVGGGGQDPSGGFGSSLGEGHIPAEHPDAQLVLNEVSGNKLLLSTGHGPPRSHPQTNYPAATLTERRPAGRTTSARKHDPTSPTARDGTAVPFLLLLALSIGQYSNFNHNRFNALVCAKGENKYGKENAFQIYREQNRVIRLVFQ